MPYQPLSVIGVAHEWSAIGTPLVGLHDRYMQSLMAGIPGSPGVISVPSTRAVVIDSAVSASRFRAGRRSRPQWPSRDALMIGRGNGDPDNSNLPEPLSAPQGLHSRVLSIPRLPQAMAPARSWVRETLAGWGMGDLAESATQIACELATNAISHTRGDSRVLLLLMYAAGTLRLEVRDEDPINLPAKRDSADSNEWGRGLIIVGALSQRWGTRVTDYGKSVWAELDFAPRRESGIDHGAARATGEWL